MFPNPTRCVPSVTYKSFFLHLLAFSWCIFGTYNDRTNYVLPKFNQYGGRFQFLTMITAYFCLVAYGVAFVVDLIQMLTGLLEGKQITKNGYTTNNSFLISLRDDLISFWAFTLSTFVVILYWSLAYIDLEGVHPAEDRKTVHLFGWYNQYLHTVPIFNALILITNVNYAYGGIKKSIIFTIIFGSSYFLWISHLAKVKGYWAYGFMEKLNDVQFGIFCVACHFIFFALYTIGRKISALSWSQEYKERVLIEKERKGL